MSDEAKQTKMKVVEEKEPTGDGAQVEYALPADALRHLPLLIEAAKGIVDVYTWRGSKGYTTALQQGVAELQAALKPFALDGGSVTEGETSDKA